MTVQHRTLTGTATRAPKSVPLSNSLPKWLQVAAALESEIEQRVREGALRLPTEAELSQYFGVSVVTVRQALSALEARGLVIRKRKLGTMIRTEGIRKRIRCNLGVIADVIEQQKSDRTEVLSSDVVCVPHQLKELFPETKNVMKFVRRRLSGGEPGSLATNYIRLDVASQIDLALLKQFPMTQIIEQNTSFKIGYVEQELTAEAADPKTAEHLGIAPLGPTMRLWGRTFDDNGGILDVADIIYRGDTFSFIQRVHCHGGENAGTLT